MCIFATWLNSSLRGVLEPEKDPKKDQKKEQKNSKRSLLAYALVPFVLSVPPVIGWALGTYLDGVFDSRPYLMYAFVILGFVAAYREFFRIIKDFGE